MKDKTTIFQTCTYYFFCVLQIRSWWVWKSNATNSWACFPCSFSYSSLDRSIGWGFRSNQKCHCLHISKYFFSIYSGNMYSACFIFIFGLFVNRRQPISAYCNSSVLEVTNSSAWTFNLSEKGIVCNNYLGKGPLRRMFYFSPKV